MPGDIDAEEDDQPMKKCCGCEIACNYRQIFTCPAMLKVFQIVLGGISCFLTLCTMSERIKREGYDFSGLGQLLTFYIIDSLCVIQCIIFLCFYVAVNDSSNNEKLKQAVKLFDVGAAIILLIGVVVFLYIMIKWQMEYAMNENNKGQMPDLPEMITVFVFTLINVLLYFMALFLK